METNEIISILRSNCSRLVQVADNQEMQKIYEATDEAIEDINILDKPEHFRKQVMLNSTMRFKWNIEIVAKCPYCGKILPTEQYPHCPYCGKMIDWEGGIYE